METFSTASWFILDSSNTLLMFISIFILNINLRNKRNVIFAIISSLIFGILDTKINGISAILSMLSFNFLFKSNSLKTSLIEKTSIFLLSFFTVILTQGVASYLVIKVLNLNFHSNMQESFLATILLIIINYSIDIFIILIMKKLIDHFLSIRYINKIFLEKLILLALSIITLSYSSLLFISYFLNTKLIYLKASLLITSIEIIFVITGCIMFIKGYLKELKTNYEIKKSKERSSYIAELERKNTELRRFKHDYKNLLSSLSVSIKTDKDDTESIQKLLDYADNNLDLSTNIENTNLYHLDDELVKGIIVTKLVSSKNKDIKTNFEIDKNVHIPKELSVEITRILGILFDNAIEASLSTDSSCIDFVLVSFNDHLEFILENKINPNYEINIDQIYQTGYTSKNNHSGMGLSTVKEIINKNSNLLLQTKLKKILF